MHACPCLPNAQDPEGFVEDGGWNFLDAEGADDEDGEGEDSEEEGARATSLA